MHQKFFNRPRNFRAMSTFGLAIGLIAMPSLARGEGDAMEMPPGQTTEPAKVKTTQPDTGSDSQGQGSGMSPQGMQGKGMNGMGTQGKGMDGMGMQGKGMDGMGMQGKVMGQGMGMQGKGMGQGMGAMGMKMMGGDSGMGYGQGMPGQGGPTGSPPNNNGQSGSAALPNGTTNQPSASIPEATRAYHIGSSDFFLDQSDKLNLTSKQTTDLTEIKRQSLAKTSELQSKIDQAEKELFALTGVDAPSESAIARKVSAIEKLRGEQRLSFIKSVGKADKVLTENQRRAFLAH